MRTATCAASTWPGRSPRSRAGRPQLPPSPLRRRLPLSRIRGPQRRLRFPILELLHRLTLETRVTPQTLATALPDTIPLATAARATTPIPTSPPAGVSLPTVAIAVPTAPHGPVTPASRTETRATKHGGRTIRARTRWHLAHLPRHPGRGHARHRQPPVIQLATKPHWESSRRRGIPEASQDVAVRWNPKLNAANDG